MCLFNLQGAVESIHLQVFHYLCCFHINDDYKTINIESKDSSCILCVRRTHAFSSRKQAQPAKHADCAV